MTTIHSMGARASLGARAVLPRFALGALLLGAGCADPVAQESPARPVTESSLTVAIVEGMSLQCPPRPNVTAKSVSPGTRFDVNRNGIVCVERVGPPDMPQGPGAPPPIESDDELFPVP
ncbi:MAG TPA: hypothetical protein VFT96_08915 [Gemmatimonadaceae bacterium]|nr:hypothetical protein [Gemmatimonadaceae bacterium]